MQVLFISPLSSSFSAKHLLLAVRELTSLFQAIVPHQQAKIIEQIPALAMQFHNDCMYLAHQLLILGLQLCHSHSAILLISCRSYGMLASTILISNW
jgi:hypothetical protein